jgi:cytochrome b involved in lipid metabolism
MWDNIMVVYVIPNDVQLSNVTGFYAHHYGNKNISDFEWFSTDPKIYNDVYHNLTVTRSGIIKNNKAPFL